MSKIDDIKAELQSRSYFFHDSGTNYIRVLDTPHVWGMPFGRDILPQAIIRQAEFERAIVEMVQKTRYRCDVASLNCPDPDWTKAIMGAIDTALSNNMNRSQPTQFRFLFGQTPTTPVGEPWNLIDFKAALIRLIRTRSSHWEMMPEIWVGRFYELEAGLLDALANKLFPPSIISDVGTKMTWNHSKIIAMDGCEALVGGHNLNMDLFRSYPPVHDVSIVVHGSAAHGSQLYLNQMWQIGSNLLTKESLDTSNLSWNNRDSEQNVPTDPLTQSNGQSYMTNYQNILVATHDSGVQPGVDPVDPVIPPMPLPSNIKAHDLRTLDDLELDVIKERAVYNTYDKFDEYKKATRMLSVGKYWVGLNKDTDFLKGSELMKKNLIMNATSSIRMSQMDLISAWKKNWSDHVVCHWIIDSLLLNKYLKVEIVVSPLDAGAGAEGDQYSFGSGARRTFELMEYYMMHEVDTDAPISDPTGERINALKRLFVAPLFYTDQVPANKLVEGDTYKWPDLTEAGHTLTLKQPPLSEQPPVAGIIGHPARAVADAGGFARAAVESAPGNHAKIMIIDDELYVVGSDNLYPGNLSEFNYLIEGVDAVNELINSYWKPLWQYSSPHAISGATSNSVKVLASYIGSQRGYTFRDKNLAQKGYVSAEFNFSSIAYGPNNKVYLTAENNLFVFNLTGELIKHVVFPDTGIIYSGICIGKNCVYASYEGTSRGVTVRSLDLDQISWFNTGLAVSGITAGDNNDVFLSSENGLYRYQDNGSLIDQMIFPNTYIKYTSISFLYGIIYASYTGPQQGVTIRNLDFDQISWFHTGFDASGIIAGDNNDVFLSSENNLYHYRNDGNLIERMLFPSSSIEYTDIAFVRPVIIVDT
jgi:murine toxin